MLVKRRHRIFRVCMREAGWQYQKEFTTTPYLYAICFLCLNNQKALRGTWALAKSPRRLVGSAMYWQATSRQIGNRKSYRAHELSTPRNRGVSNFELNPRIQNPDRAPTGLNNLSFGQLNRSIRRSIVFEAVRPSTLQST